MMTEISLFSGNQQLLANEKEELNIKKRMVDQLEAMEKKQETSIRGLMSTLDRMANSLEALVSASVPNPPQQQPQQQQYFGPTAAYQQPPLQQPSMNQQNYGNAGNDFTGVYNHLRDL